MGCLNTGKLKPLLAGMVDSFSPRQKSGKRREGLECQGKDNLIHSCCCQTTPTPKACVFEKGFFWPWSFGPYVAATDFLIGRYLKELTR